MGSIRTVERAYFRRRISRTKAASSAASQCPMVTLVTGATASLSALESDADAVVLVDSDAVDWLEDADVCSDVFSEEAVFPPDDPQPAASAASIEVVSNVTTILFFMVLLL